MLWLLNAVLLYRVNGTLCNGGCNFFEAKIVTNEFLDLLKMDLLHAVCAQRTRYLTRLSLATLTSKRIAYLVFVYQQTPVN